MSEVVVKAPEEHRQSLPLKAARTVLNFAMDEYLEASGYYRSIGAQTSSEAYGGSRSLIYYQMLARPNTLTELMAARREFVNRHDGETGDESGALLRIMGYKVRKVPVLGKWFEAKVREDDIRMAQTNFDYPSGYERVVGEPEDLRNYFIRAQQIEE